MKYINIIIFLLFFLNHISSQTYNKFVSDNEILELIKWDISNVQKIEPDRIFFRKKIIKKRILWKNAILDLFNVKYDFEHQMKSLIKNDDNRDTTLFKLIDIFDSSDFEYMKKQFDNELQNDWNFKSKKGRLVKYTRNNFYSYSIPLFNKAHTKAITYKEFYCGSVCAYGYVQVYFKTNNSWDLYKTILLWES